MATSGEGNPLQQQIAADAAKKFEEKEGDIKGAITSLEKTKEDAPPKPASTFIGKNNFVATSRDPRKPPPGFVPEPPRRRKQADAAWMNNAAPAPPPEPRPDSVKPSDIAKTQKPAPYIKTMTDFDAPAVTSQAPAPATTSSPAPASPPAPTKEETPQSQAEAGCCVIL